MKNRKSLICAVIILALLSLFCLSSCDEAVYEEYKAAFDKTTALESFALSGSIGFGDGVDSIFGNSFELSRTPEECLLSMNTSILGINAATSFYAKDGYIYSDLGLFKQRFEGGFEYIDNDVEGFSCEMLEFDEEMIGDVGFVTTEKSKTLSFTLDGEMIKDKVEEAYGDLLLTRLGEHWAVEYDDVEVELTLNDGYLVIYDVKVSYTASFTYGETSSESFANCFELHIEYTGLGDEVTVEAPDLDSYHDLF